MLKDKLNVFIVTEGGLDIGFGHVTRCVSLYQAFSEKGILPQLIVNGDNSVKDPLRGKRHRIFNWIEEKEKLFDTIKNSGIVIVDSYLANVGFYEKVSALTKIPVYIDDNKRLDYPEGTVINASVYAEELDYAKRKASTYLLGTGYIPLRKEFLGVLEKRTNENIKDIMITFGGTDLKNITPRVLIWLIEHYPLLVKNVIIGKGFRNMDDIKAIADNNTNLIYYPDAIEMRKLMLASDVAISAGGQTLYELAKIGVPTIAVAVADNQIENTLKWAKSGFVEYAGTWNDSHLMDNMERHLISLRDMDSRKKRYEIARKMVDGLGATRIVSHCIKKYFEKSIVLRDADSGDINDVYRLSNDENVRRNSFNSKRIKVKEHKDWFAGILNDPYRILLIASLENDFLGQVRFDIDKKQAVISVSVVNRYRQSGAGKVMLRKALNRLATNHPDLTFVKAFVKEENTVSRKFFESLDFRHTSGKAIENQNALEYSIGLKGF